MSLKITKVYIIVFLVNMFLGKRSNILKNNQFFSFLLLMNFCFAKKRFYTTSSLILTRYLLRINTFRLMIHTIVSKNLHAHHLTKRLRFLFNLGHLEGMSSGEVLSTMTEKPAEKISEGVCLENAPLEKK